MTPPNKSDDLIVARHLPMTPALPDKLNTHSMLGIALTNAVEAGRTRMPWVPESVVLHGEGGAHVLAHALIARRQFGNTRPDLPGRIVDEALAKMPAPAASRSLRPDIPVSVR